jgi:hypothetical protein
MHVFDFEGDSWMINFAATPSSPDLMGPFVDLPLASGDDERLPGTVAIMTSSCEVVAEYSVTPGDYRITISAGGELAIENLGLGQRPGRAPPMEATDDCVGTAQP